MYALWTITITYALRCSLSNSPELAGEMYFHSCFNYIGRKKYLQVVANSSSLLARHSTSTLILGKTAVQLQVLVAISYDISG